MEKILVYQLMSCMNKLRKGYGTTTINTRKKKI